MAPFIKSLSFLELKFIIWVIAGTVILKSAVGALEYTAAISSEVDGLGIYWIDGEIPEVMVCQT